MDICYALRRGVADWGKCKGLGRKISRRAGAYGKDRK